MPDDHVFVYRFSNSDGAEYNPHILRRQIKAMVEFLRKRFGGKLDQGRAMALEIIDRMLREETPDA